MVEVRPNAGIRLKVAVDHLARLGHGDIERLREPIGLLAVNNAEVHRLGTAPQLRRDLINRHAKHTRRRLGMEVLALVERCHQVLVGRKVREQSKLDLGVVHRKEHAPRRHRERRLDRMPQL